MKEKREQLAIFHCLFVDGCLTVRYIKGSTITQFSIGYTRDFGCGINNERLAEINELLGLEVTADKLSHLGKGEWYMCSASPLVKDLFSGKCILAKLYEWGDVEIKKREAGVGSNLLF